MIGRVFRIGVDLGGFLENETSVLRELHDIAFEDIAGGGAQVLIARGWQAMLLNAEDAAGL